MAAMPAVHGVIVDGDWEDGTFYPSLFRFTCTGGPDSECHQWCAQGCEEQCFGDGIILAGDHPVDLWRSAQAHRWEPMPPDGRSCRIVDWLDNSDENYADDDPHRPGVHRIEEEWDGDGYLWRYADPLPEPAFVGHP